MRLIIAEKKSLADAIAAAYTCKKNYDKQSIVAGDDVIAWSAGHILRQKQPDEYDPKYKQWRADTLPIIPENYDNMLVPRDDTMALFNNIKALLKKADCVVNAGDADREGQLLIDEILDYVGYKKPVYRLLLTDLSPDAVRKALNSMKDNKEYKGVYEAGLGRQRADWIYGMNLSRVYTITSETKLGKALSVGRVQTPTLALVVNRDREIENFEAKPYFEVFGAFDVSGKEMTAKWQPFGPDGIKKEDRGTIDREGFNPDGKIIDKGIIDALKTKVCGKTGKITGYKTGIQKSAPKKPYKLPQLQIEASQHFGLAPKETLAICQKLYEAKILTYPRSDCEYLPMSVFDRRESIVAAAADILSLCARSGGKNFDFNEVKNCLDMAKKQSCFNDKKVEEHFAIIPTGQKPSGDFSKGELAILELVARRFMALFMPDAEYATAECGVEVEGELFTAKSKKLVKPGWKALYSDYKDYDKEEQISDDGEEEDGSELSAIPETKDGEPAVCNKIDEKSKETKPPKRFTEATLLKAMNNVHAFVKDAEIKKVLKEVQGIGTAATQANIISELIEKRGFIGKEKKNLISTAAGRSLIDSLPVQVTVPDMTALWEMQLDDIAHNKETLEGFMSDVIGNVTALVGDRLANAEIVTRSSGTNEPLKAIKCPVCGTKGGCKQYEGKFGKYWKCECGFKSSGAAAPKVGECPYCGAVLQRVKKKDGGYVWVCADKERCGKFIPDSNGTPGYSWCPKCRQIGKDAVTLRFISKDGKKYYWRCLECGNFFDDNKGFLVPKM